MRAFTVSTTSKCALFGVNWMLIPTDGKNTFTPEFDPNPTELENYNSHTKFITN